MASDPNEPYTISPAQFASYDRDGYLILHDALSPLVAKQLLLWSRDVHSWPNVPEKHMAYTETLSDGTIGICRTENFANFHEGFNDWFRGRRLMSILEQLGGEPMHLFKEKINFKEPGAGGFDPHIDAPAYQAAGVDRNVTFLMAVDAMDMTNGCLEVVPGSHKSSVPKAANNCIDPDWVPRQQWASVELPPGGMLLFGSFLAHRSGPNLSDRWRAGIYATYNAVSDGGDKHDSYYEMRRKMWPPTSERKAGERYEEGALIFAFGSPMTGGKEVIEDTLRRKGTEVAA